MTGFFIKKTRCVRILLLLAIVLATGCRKPGTIDNGGTPDPGTIPGIPEVPETTPAGTPIGTAEQTVIGPEGGGFYHGRQPADFGISGRRPDCSINRYYSTDNQ